MFYLLDQNHRSSQSVLDAAGKLIGRNSERLTIDKDLKAVNPAVNSLPEQVELRRYPTLALETSEVARQIVALKGRGVPLSRITVIYRNHYQSEEIIRFLAAKDIPVVTRKRVDVLAEPLVGKILDTMRYLSAELRRPHSGPACTLARGAIGYSGSQCQLR
ncbi:MAG: hypothetical protein PVSMB11_03130 [Desulfuromonadaceae bacterium]